MQRSQWLQWLQLLQWMQRCIQAAITVDIGGVGGAFSLYSLNRILVLLCGAPSIVRHPKYHFVRESKINGFETNRPHKYDLKRGP